MEKGSLQLEEKPLEQVYKEFVIARQRFRDYCWLLFPGHSDIWLELLNTEVNNIDFDPVDRQFLRVELSIDKEVIEAQQLDPPGSG